MARTRRSVNPSPVALDGHEPVSVRSLMPLHDPTVPEPLATPLAAFAAALAAGTSTVLLERLVLAAMATLPPGRVADLDHRIAHVGRLWAIPPDPAALLPSHPQLAWLLLAHRSGFAREAALASLSGPAPSPFHLALLAWRLADWVPQVRAAATRAAARVFPATGAPIAAAAAPALLLRWADWSRRDPAGTGVADALLHRADVAAALAIRFATTPTGPMAQELVQALSRGPMLDAALDPLARTAIQPAIRAVAFRALIAGEANWPAGYRLDPADKRFGRLRWLRHIARRPLANPPDPDAPMRLALADRSALVRRVGADALIRRRHAVPDLPALAARLEAERNPSLRARGLWLRSVGGS